MRRRAEMERVSASRVYQSVHVMVLTHEKNERAAYGWKDDDKACGRRL